MIERRTIRRDHHEIEIAIGSRRAGGHGPEDECEGNLWRERHQRVMEDGAECCGLEHQPMQFIEDRRPSIGLIVPLIPYAGHGDEFGVPERSELPLHRTGATPDPTDDLAGKKPLVGMPKEEGEGVGLHRGEERTQRV